MSVKGSLSPGLQGIYDATQSGLQSNMGFIGRTPTEQLQDLEAGQNSYYNLNAEMNKRQLEQQMAQAQMRFSRSGLENSTSRGGFEGSLINDAVLRDLATRQSSLDYQNQTANQNAGTQNAIMQGLAAMTQYPMDMANAGLNNAFGAQDQMGMFNAQQMQQANIQNAQWKAQADAANRASMGNMISGGIGTVAALGLAPFTGGASLMALPGTLGSMAGGGGGGGFSMPSSGFQFSNPFNKAPMQQGGAMSYFNGQNPYFNSSGPSNMFLGQTYGL